MLKLRRKFVASVSVLVALGAVVLMSAITSVPLGRAILVALRDQNPVGATMLLNGFAVSVYLVLGVFMISRWSVMADEISAMRDELQKMHLAILEKSGIQRLRDDAHLWAGIVVRLISDNPTFLDDCKVQKVAGGKYRISVDDLRIGNFVDRLTADIVLTYIFYVPKNVVGENPAISVLRLVHLIRTARKLAGEKGLLLKARVRVIMIDAPRPTDSIFIGSRMANGVPVSFAREYHRDINPMARNNTPTAKQTFDEHQNANDIAELEAIVNRSVSNGDEIEFAEIERALAPLLPSVDGGTAPIIAASTWNRIIRSLYKGAAQSNFEMVTNGDAHIAFHKNRPSINNYTGHGCSVARPPQNFDDVCGSSL